MSYRRPGTKRLLLSPAFWLSSVRIASHHCNLGGMELQRLALSDFQAKCRAIVSSERHTVKAWVGRLQFHQVRGASPLKPLA